MSPARNDGHVKLYEPTRAKRVWRIVCRRPGSSSIERTAGDEAEALRIYDQLVAWERAQLPVAPRRGAKASQVTVDQLAERTLTFLRANGRSARYIDKVDDVLRLHILPHIGDIAVAEWSPADCTRVIAAARQAELSAFTIQDIGSAMRALVSEAHRKPRLLLAGDDPMADVNYAVRANAQGQASVYVPANQRPTEEWVQKLTGYLDARGAKLGRPWLGLVPRIMGYGGCRLGEALALRACDIQGQRLVISGTVETRNRKGALPSRKDTKNHKSRITVLPPHLAELVTKRAEEVGGGLAPLFPTDQGSWYSTNNYWKIAAGPAIKAGAWKHDWDLENLRHHAATWWHQVGVPIETISQMLGHHSVAFTYAVYFRTSEDSIAEAERLVSIQR